MDDAMLFPVARQCLWLALLIPHFDVSRSVPTIANGIVGQLSGKSVVRTSVQIQITEGHCCK